MRLASGSRYDLRPQSDQLLLSLTTTWKEKEFHFFDIQFAFSHGIFTQYVSSHATRTVFESIAECYGHFRPATISFCPWAGRNLASPTWIIAKSGRSTWSRGAWPTAAPPTVPRPQCGYQPRHWSCLAGWASGRVRLAPGSRQCE